MEEGTRKPKGQKKLGGRTDRVRSREMHERRPLKTVALSPPEYAIDPQLLLDSYLEKEVRFAGVVSSIPIALDSTNRTNILRVIDRGKREKVIPWSVTYDHDAIFCLSVHNIKLSRRDGDEELLLRVPIHEVAATCYIRDDNQHILAIKYASQAQPADEMCQVAVLYCESRTSSEELCSLIGQCFQIVYTEATIEFLDHRLIEATHSLSVSSSNITTTTRSDNSNSNRSTPQAGRNFLDHKMSFMSQSQHNLDFNGATSSSSASRSLPMSRRKPSQSSETDLSLPGKELLQQYMKMLHSKLEPRELREFAHLLQASATNMQFADFCDKLFELYGPQRKHLLSGMRPFIPEKNAMYFESFLGRIGVGGNHSFTESSLSSGGYRRGMSAASSYSGTNVAVDEYDRILNDISGDMSNLESSVDVNTNPEYYMPKS